MKNESIPSSPPAQFLEWTFLYGMSDGMFIAYIFGAVFLQTLIGVLILVILDFLCRFVFPLYLVLICCFVFITLVWLMLALSNRNGPPASRTLRVDRQTITLTDTSVWGPEERRMKVDGAIQFYAAHLDVFERLFTFDSYLVCSVYHVKFIRNSESLLFPCRDEWEQTQIIKRIKEFLPQ